MYRMAVGHERGKLSDIAVCMLAFCVILLCEPALVLSGFPQTVKTIGQSVFVAAILIFCIWFYRRRLRSVRYTLITDDTEFFDEEEIESAPEAFSEFEDGSFFAENTVGLGAGTYLCVVHAKEITAFCEPGQEFVTDKKVRYVYAAIGKKKNACKLVYEQDGETICAYIDPTPVLQAYLADRYGQNNKTESD